MSFSLPDLPYPKDALAPHISAETLEFHHDKHHKTYVDNLNNLVKGTPFYCLFSITLSLPSFFPFLISFQGTENENKSLEQIIKAAGAGPLFNNAAQTWNHTFYWHSLSPNGGGEPDGAVKDAIVATWGSFDAFKQVLSSSIFSPFFPSLFCLTHSLSSSSFLTRPSLFFLSSLSALPPLSPISCTYIKFYNMIRSSARRLQDILRVAGHGWC